MALHNIQLGSNAIDVSVNRSSSRIAVLHENSISIVRYAPKIKDVLEPTIESTASVPSSAVLKAVQISYLGDEDVYVLMTNVVELSYAIYHLRTSRLYTILNTLSAAVSIFPAQSHEYLCVSHGDEVFKVPLDKPADEPSEHAFVDLENICVFPSPAPLVEVTQVDDQVGITENLLNGLRHC